MFTRGDPACFYSKVAYRLRVAFRDHRGLQDMEKENHRVDAIDLERVIMDPEYRRAVIDELKALRHDEKEEEAESSMDGRGERHADEDASFLRSNTE